MELKLNTLLNYNPWFIGMIRWVENQAPKPRFAEDFNQM
jgi:hypothetical protein